MGEKSNVTADKKRTIISIDCFCVPRVCSLFCCHLQTFDIYTHTHTSVLSQVQCDIENYAQHSYHTWSAIASPAYIKIDMLLLEQKNWSEGWKRNNSMYINYPNDVFFSLSRFATTLTTCLINDIQRVDYMIAAQLSTVFQIFISKFEIRVKEKMICSIALHRKLCAQSSHHERV